MNFGGISLDAYNNVGAGFGEEQLGNVELLNKALAATDSRGGAVEGLTTASGAPLKVESLDSTLRVVTFRQNNIVLWKELPVLPAYNTVEEYNKQISYGSDTGGFVDEGELPEENDAIYVRQSQLVKYLGTTRVVTHPMTLVNSAHGDVITRQAEAGTLWILQRLEPALFRADTNINTREFKGFYTQQREDFATELDWLDSDNVVDCRGYTLSEVYAETAANAIIENYGVPTDLYATPRVLSDFVKTFYSKERVMLPAPGSGQSVGLKITEFVSTAGTINLKPDIFCRNYPTRTVGDGASSGKSPVAPVADSSAPVAAVGATVARSKFISGADNGNYLYGVTAINKFGESAMTVLSQSVVAVVADGAADLKFTSGASTYAATGYRIYRSLKGATYSASTKFYPIFDISAGQLSAGYNGGATGVVRDLNRYLPNTTKAFMPQRDVEVLSFKQLAPLMKMDLAVIGPAYRFMVLLYGTPMLYAPRKMVTLINVGQTFAT